MNRASLRTEDFLEHLREAATRIQTYISGKSEQDFLSEPMVQDAVVRNIEILGEASKNLLEILPDAATRFPGLPFRSIYALRNQLAHGYFSSNMLRVWEVAHKDAPQLLVEILKAIEIWQSTNPAPQNRVKP